MDAMSDDQSNEEWVFTVSDECGVGERLDAFITTQHTDMNRSAAGRYVRGGHVTLNGEQPKKRGVKLRLGDVITLTIPEDPLEALPVAEDIPLEIVYNDDDLAIINKAPGMVVHPAKGHYTGTMVNALLHHLPTLSPGGSPQRPGIVHRLDMDTSGLLVVARNDLSHQRLQEQFAAHTVGRAYIAVVLGPRIEDTGTIRTLYGRHPRDRKKMSSMVKEGKHAVTHWEVLGRSQSMALLRLRLETGRTHQIRVHLSDTGHPVVGDPLYGRGIPKTGGAGRIAVEFAAARRMPRQALHAKELGFDHPTTGERTAFSSQIPTDMAALIERCFGEEILASL